MKDSVKLEWLGLELGNGARLVDFARKYQDFFGEKTGADSQRAACLKLYRQYANIGERKDLERGAYPSVAEARKKLYSMECQVPPGELEEFQKLWDADAPRRCRECHCELPADAALGQRFCCAEHAEANAKVVCRVVKRGKEVRGGEVVVYCSGDVVHRNGCLVCTACGQGLDVAKTVSRIHKLSDDTELNKSLKRNAESLQIYNNVLGKFAVQNDPQHVPAWTKKRRL